MYKSSGVSGLKFSFTQDIKYRAWHTDEKKQWVNLEVYLSLFSLAVS